MRNAGLKAHVARKIVEEAYEQAMSVCRHLDGHLVQCDAERQCLMELPATVAALVQPHCQDAELDEAVEQALHKCWRMCTKGLQSCVDSVVPRDDLQGREREVQWQADLARICTMPGVPRCTALLVGRANVDYYAAAAQLAAEVSSLLSILPCRAIDAEASCRGGESRASTPALQPS